MDRDEAEASARAVVMLIYLAIGVISLVIFLIYWCSCRRSGIPGVILEYPNSVQPNCAPGQNAVGPSYVMLGNPAGPVVASNPHAAVMSGTSGVMCTSAMTPGAPPSYNHMYHDRAEQVPHFKS